MLSTGTKNCFHGHKKAKSWRVGYNHMNVCRIKISLHTVCLFKQTRHWGDRAK